MIWRCGWLALLMLPTLVFAQSMQPAQSGNSNWTSYVQQKEQEALQVFNGLEMNDSHQNKKNFFSGSGIHYTGGDNSSKNFFNSSAEEGDSE